MREGNNSSTDLDRHPKETLELPNSLTVFSLKACILWDASEGSSLRAKGFSYALYSV